MTTYRIKIHRSGQPVMLDVLADQPRVIGRASDSDIVLKEDSVSRRHARLSADGSEVHIEDLDSSNGVYLNGARVRRAAVTPGDRIRVGNYTIRVEPMTSAGVPVNGRTELDYADVGTLHAQLVDQDHSQLAFLYRLSQRMAAQRQLRPLLDLVLEEVMGVFPAARGFIRANALQDGAPPVYASRTRRGQNPAPPISETLLYHVQHTRSSVLTRDAAADERFDNADSIAAHQIQAALCVPLISRDTVHGAIYLDAESASDPFSPTHLQLLSVVGQVAGVAVENIYLFEKQLHQERLAAIGQAVSATSHDMRNILTGISGGTELIELARESGSWERAAGGLSILRKSLTRFENLVNSLLDFSRKTEICAGETDIGALVSEVIETLAPAAAKVGVTFAFENRLQDTVLLDAQQVHRVLVNLARNAMDAMNGSVGVVQFVAEADDLEHIIRVRDSGAGIPAESLSRLGQAFFTTKEGAGTGLGLALCYRIMEQHGGRIEVESEPGRGTTFSLVFPDPCRTTARMRPAGV